MQIDVYKRQISELHGKLEAENNRADKSDFETKRLLEKTEALSVERDRLQAERDTLKEEKLELQDQVYYHKKHPCTRVQTNQLSPILSLPMTKKNLLLLVSFRLN